jgi:hypothetical protein
MKKQIVFTEEELIDLYEDLTLNVVNDLLSTKSDFILEDWDEYNKEEVNEVLEVLKNKKIKYFVGKLEVIWSSIDTFKIKVNKNTFYFIRYILNTYSDN